MPHCQNPQPIFTHRKHCLLSHHFQTNVTTHFRFCCENSTGFLDSEVCLGAYHFIPGNVIPLFAKHRQPHLLLELC